MLCPLLLYSKLIQLCIYTLFYILFILDCIFHLIFLEAYKLILFNDCITAIRTGCSVPTKIEEFRNKYRNADVLLFDDIDFLNGKHSTQDEFLHTFNCLYEAGKQIVMTGKMSPRKLVGHMEENVASRLGWCVTVEIPESSYNPEPLAEEGQTRIELLNKRVQNLETELKKEKQRNIELEIIMKKLRGQLALASCTLSEASQE